MLSQFTRAVIAIHQFHTAKIDKTFAESGALLAIGTTTMWRAAHYLKDTMAYGGFTDQELVELTKDEYDGSGLASMDDEGDEIGDKPDFDGSHAVLVPSLEARSQNQLNWKWHYVSEADVLKLGTPEYAALRGKTVHHGRPVLLSLEELQDLYKNEPCVLALLKHLEDASSIVSGSAKWRKLKVQYLFVQPVNPFFTQSAHL